MTKANCILPNFDARISKIDIRPKNRHTKVTISSRMYNVTTDKPENVKLVFTDVAAIDFRINYFDNMIGAEVMGLFEIADRDWIEALVKDNFRRRKEVYLLEGHYHYDEADDHDMLNTFDFMGAFEEEKEHYRAFIQNVDAGVYIIVAKDFQVI